MPSDVVDLEKYRERRAPQCPEAGSCRLRALCRSWNQCLPRSHVLAPRPA